MGVRLTFVVRGDAGGAEVDDFVRRGAKVELGLQCVCVRVCVRVCVSVCMVRVVCRCSKSVTTPRPRQRW